MRAVSSRCHFVYALAPAGVRAREANDLLNEYVADESRGLAVWHDHFVGSHGGVVVLDVRDEAEEARLADPGPLEGWELSVHPLTFSLSAVGFSAQTSFTLEQYRGVGLEELAAAESDELRRFPVEIEGDDVYVDLTPRRDPVEHQRRRLQVGLERNIPLVVAKAAIVLAEADPTGVDALRAGLDFGVRRRAEGWNRGLTTLTCFMNLAPRIASEERSAALYHGLSDVTLEAAEDQPRFPLEPLPGDADPERLGRWFRSFIEVRDAEGAERALVSAARAGASPQQLADMLFAAATDHRYIEGGHTLDFVNKALEALDIVGWERAESVLSAMAA